MHDAAAPSNQGQVVGASPTSIGKTNEVSVAFGATERGEIKNRACCSGWSSPKLSVGNRLSREHDGSGELEGCTHLVEGRVLYRWGIRAFWAQCLYGV